MILPAQSRPRRNSKISKKITVEDILKKSVKAHKAGQFQEADKLYKSILQEQPKVDETKS